jgi:hypothetical protein
MLSLGAMATRVSPPDKTYISPTGRFARRHSHPSSWAGLQYTIGDSINMDGLKHKAKSL